MKNLFKKLHNIVTDQADDNSHNNSSSSSSPPSASPSREHKQQQSPLLGLPGWLNSMAGGRVGSGTNLSSLSASSPPHAPAAASPSPPPPPSSSVSSSSSAFSHLSSTTTTDVGEEVGGRRPTSLLDDEEYQIQVALELSAREDPEAFQIEAVKQISLGSVSPSQTTPAEVVAYRYWNYNVLSYGDKIFDGFYDLYGILSDHEAMKMPSLVDLQYTFPSGNIFWEAVLVNRTEDPELSKLEQKATMMAMESRSCIFSLPSSALVEKIASLVSNFMGGPAFNNEQMLQAWRSHSSSLRAKLGSNILPIGLLTVGLARHRALLFKVLADSVGIPCQLVKGKFHTGADDGAMNIVKLVDGREYIVDLMAEPGSLIPSDATDSQIEYGENTFASSHSVDEVNINMVSCSSGDLSLVNYLSSGGTPDTRSSVDRLAILEHSGINASAMRCSTNLTSKEVESSAGLHTDTVEIHNNSRTPLYNEEKANHESSSRSNSPHSIVRSPSWADGINSPSVNMMKVKDVSQYMIDATKENPQLVQKLHDVLRESGVVVPPNLFFEISKEKQDNATSSDCNSTDIEYGKGMSGFGEPDCKSSVGLGSPGMSPNKAMQKVILPRSDVDHVKPAVGLGTKNPLGMGDIAGIPYSSQCAESPQSQALQTKLIDNVPVAAAVATAAIVASSMVVAAGNRNSESNAEAAAAVTAAAALVATTAAVTVQQEQLLHGAPIPDYSFAPVGKKHDSPTFMEQKYRDAGHDYDLEPSMKTAVDNLEAKGNSDKSIGSGSTKSDDSFDDVAEVEISWEEIILGGRIGLGSYGEVYRGDWHGTEVAVKKFLNQDISGVALEEFRTEVRIMKKLRHPNVVLFMGAVTRAPNLAIVTEFLHRGSLFRLIHRPNNQLDERRRMRMALDVARGMNYLHNCSPVIVHRDLKSPNLLVDKNWVVKVCDFGLSRMKHSTFLSSRSTAGTAEWMAPEILRNEPSDEKCDVYSFGVILWELCTMQQPWGGMNAMQVVGAVGFQHRRLDIPADIEPGVASIIQRCWETDSAKRPSFSEIMTELKPLQKLISGNQSVRQKNSSGCQADTL